MRKIAVVGASGFVGSTLVERLLDRRSDEVIPFIHSSGNAMRLARRGIELQMLDLLDSAQVDAALSGVTHVINCSRGGDEVMLTGLKNMLNASKKHHIQRFVHLSSVAVYGDPPPPESAHENAPARPERGTYGGVKLQQDQIVRKAVEEGVPSVILCPPNISGPYSYYLLAIVDALRNNEFALLDAGSTPCNLIDVTNLSHAIELALDAGAADGERLFVTDGEDTSWHEVIESLLPLVESVSAVPAISREQLSRAAGAPVAAKISLTRSLKHLLSSDVREALRKDPLWAKVDGTIRRGIARMGRAVEDRMRLSVEGPVRVALVAPGQRLNWGLCRQQLRGVTHSCASARERLGYKPLYSVSESMDAFRKWYRFQHGMDTVDWPLLEQLR